MVASANIFSPEQERKQLEDDVAKIKILIQSCEKKVGLFQYLVDMTKLFINIIYLSMAS